MKLTVEAFSKNQKSHSVQVEIVATTWTFAECNQKCDEDQQRNPEPEYGSHGHVNELGPKTIKMVRHSPYLSE